MRLKDNLAKLLVVLLALVSLVLLVATIRTAVIHTAGSQPASIQVSDNVSLVPVRRDVSLRPLDARSLRAISPALNSAHAINVAGRTAVKTAAAEFGIRRDRIDPHVVSAVVNPTGHPLLRGTKAWLVTANVDSPGQGPALSGVVFHKLVIAVSLESGKYLFAYPTDS
jgi:hypothetical protein